MEFISDTMVSGRKFRTLNVIEDRTRKVLAIEADTFFSFKNVIRTLSPTIDVHGKTADVRVDNGPDFTWQHVLQMHCNTYKKKETRTITF